MTDVDRWVTISEATSLLGKSDRTIRRYVSDGSMPSRKKGGRVYVNVLGFPIVEPEPDTESEFDIKELKAEVDRLRALLKEVSGERDYLRQLVAVTFTEQKRLEPGRRPWWQFWKTE